MNRQEKISPKTKGVLIAVLIAVLIVVAALVWFGTNSQPKAQTESSSGTVAAISHKTADSAAAGSTTQAASEANTPEASAPKAERVFDDSEVYVPNQVMITVGRNVSQSDLNKAISEAGIEATSLSMVSDTLYGDDCLLLLEYSGNEDVQTVSDKLVASGAVSSAEPDAIMKLADVDTSSSSQAAETNQANSSQAQSSTASESTNPDSSLDSTQVNDYFASLQWGLTSTGAYDAWDTVKTNGSVTVATVDSGAYYTHEDLTSNLILGNYAKNTYEETTGADAILDDVGHGTHVAGIIAAEANNSLGVAGISYNAKVLPIKATCNSQGQLMSSDIIEAVNYIVSLKTDPDSPDYLKNIRVINMSIGGYGSSLNYEMAIDSAKAAGILVIAAAGNDSTSNLSYPASYDNVISVSAMSSTSDGIGEFDSSYSNYGSRIDLAAPGTKIASAYNTGDDAYVYLSGTSMATPMVSGVAAAIFSCNTAYTPDDVENILESTATDLGDAGRDDLYGYGAVNFAKAAAAVGATECAHSNVVTDSAVEPTCTTPGKTAGTHCADCGKVLVAQEEIPALGHEYAAVVTDPTCTEQGFTTYTCSRCNDSYVGDYTSALGHSYAAVVTDPTCTEQGFTTFTCARCNDSYVGDYTNALGHTLVVDQAVEATCTTDGLTEGSHCSVCNETVEEQTVVPALGHDYISVVTEPTCTEQGFTTYTCTRCNDSYVGDYTDAKGHSYAAVVTDPTCTEQGFTTYTCTECGDNYVDAYVDATGHSYTDTITAPTCTEQGFTTHTCTECGDFFVDSYTDAKGHTPVTDLAVEPTCTTPGKTAGTHCAVCNAVIDVQEEIPALGHNYVDKVTAPTCTEQGYTTHTCTRCNDSFVDSYVDAVGHTPVVTKEAVAATDSTPGKTAEIRCSVCNLLIEAQVETPALGHNYEAVVTLPTCTEPGYTTHTCTICGNSYVDSPTPAKGHTEAVTKEAVAPTCTTVGTTEEKACSVCGAVLEAQKEIPALGHEYTETVTASTCKTQGYTTHTCTRCNDSYVNSYTATTSHTPEIVPAVAATCTKTGLTQGSKCSVCGTILEAQKTTEALGHDWGEWVVVKAATQYSTGLERRVCTRDASHVEEREIAKLSPSTPTPTNTFTYRYFFGMFGYYGYSSDFGFRMYIVFEIVTPSRNSYNYYSYGTVRGYSPRPTSYMYASAPNRGGWF